MLFKQNRVKIKSLVGEFNRIYHQSDSIKFLGNVDFVDSQSDYSKKIELKLQISIEIVCSTRIIDV